ncbi:MAG TPA: VWA domain-containing protein [Pyrinomonadaceae bacterium]|jgi:VWFA-related protein
MKDKLTAPFVILVVGLVCVAPVIRARAQTDAPKTRSFGSSLKTPKAGAPGRPDRDVDPRAAENESPEEVVRVETSLVLLDVLVTDAGGARPVTGLKRDDFVVTEDGQAQDVSFFALGDDARGLPRSIVLILDRSESQLPYLEASVEAAKKLVDQLAPADEMAVVTDDVQLASGFTRDKKRLKSTLDALKKFTFEGYRTRSMQFSALLATLRELVDAGRRRPLVILQTDGDEVGRLSGWPPVAGEQLETYGYTMGDVYAEAERSRARIYTVVPNERLLGLPEGEVEGRARLTLEKRRAARLKTKDMWYGMRRLPPEKTSGTAAPAPAWLNDEDMAARMREFREKMERRGVETLVEGQAAAARVAELTGGWASYLEKPGDAEAVYGRILADINSRYVIGYYPSNKALDGKLRQTKVEVRGHPEYVVQGRRSYYALPR